MALLVIEGFDHYGDGNEVGRGGWQSGTPANVDVVAGRIDGKSLQLRFNGIGAAKGFPTSSTFTLGFAYKITSAPDSTIIVNLRNYNVVHLRMEITAAGELLLDRGTTQIDITSGLGLTHSTWYYIEITATIHNSTGAYDIHIDGSQVLQDSNVDTQNGGFAECDNFQFVGDSALQPEFDDVYLLDTVGSDNTTFLGDCHVETVYPDADGNETDFTPLSSTNVSNVDDGATPDDDSTYNHSATATDRDLYGFAALTGSIDTIFGVDAKMLVRKEDAGFREVRVIGRSNVTEVESGDKTLGIDWIYKTHIFENDPDGGTDWDEAAVNAAEFGIDLQT